MTFHELKSINKWKNKKWKFTMTREQLEEGMKDALQCILMNFHDISFTVKVFSSRIWYYLCNFKLATSFPHTSCRNKFWHVDASKNIFGRYCLCGSPFIHILWLLQALDMGLGGKTRLGINVKLVNFEYYDIRPKFQHVNNMSTTFPTYGTDSVKVQFLTWFLWEFLDP